MNTIFRTLAGSHLYGTNTPESDIDHRGVLIPDVENMLGFTGLDQIETRIPIDSVTYSLKKFMQLASACNPNIVELLFAPTQGETCIIVQPEWLDVLSIRDSFLSRKAKYTFSGYAHAQMERMKTHHNYMVGDIPLNVVPEDFGAFKNAEGNYVWPSGVEQNAYSNAHNRWTNYLEWVQNRNPARHELEAKYGYDTKHGMHLVRLITEGAELLTDGKITLPRPDANFLLEVKNGYFDYDQICQFAQDGDDRLTEIEAVSKLPFGPNLPVIEELMMYLYGREIEAWFHENYYVERD